ncbi:MAG: TolC family protein [Spirochaetota bacterium]
MSKYLVIFFFVIVNVVAQPNATSDFEREIRKLFPYSNFVTGKKNKELTLKSILFSVENYYPEIIAAEKEIEIAEYEFLSSQGNFDLKLKSYAALKQGNYDNEKYNIQFDQPVTFMGMSFFAGYRKGIGDFPVYDGKYFTRPRGEIRAGVRMPLWRDRGIDRRRVLLRKARLGKSMGIMFYEGSRLRVYQLSAHSYWKWVASGQKYLVIKGLLEIAQKRMQQLQDKVDLGYLPGMEKIDNERVVFERETQLIAAQREFQKASIKLSLFYRNPKSEVVLPLPSQVPERFPQTKSISLEEFKKDIVVAWKKRPELRAISIMRGKKELDLQLARNNMKPRIDLEVAASKDVSGGPVLEDKNNPYGIKLPPELKSERFNRTDLEAKVIFSLPLQRRKEKGKLGATRGKLLQISQKEKLLRDKIRAEVQDALSGVENARAEVAVAKKAAEVAEKLEGMEREKFDLGASSLFKLNLREQKTAETKIKYIKSLANHHISLAIYQSVTAEWL